MIQVVCTLPFISVSSTTHCVCSSFHLGQIGPVIAPQKVNEDTIFSYTEGMDPRRSTIDSTRDGSEDTWVKEVILNSGDRSGRSCCWKTDGYFKGRNPFIVIFYFF